MTPGELALWAAVFASYYTDEIGCNMWSDDERVTRAVCLASHVVLRSRRLSREPTPLEPEPLWATIHARKEDPE